MRAGMRTWATGQAWWQGDEGPYWGHNAVVRIAPFRAHCRLPLLPGGRHILSHDQVEAAVLRGAGWGVRVLPDEDGSWEANPPALPEFLRRDLRWLAGNLQYRHLLRLPDLRPMGRWQLCPGDPAVRRRAVVPAVPARRGGGGRQRRRHRRSRRRRPLALTIAWLGALYAPKLLGYAEVALSPDKRSRYGGLARFAGGAAGGDSASRCCSMRSRWWRRPARCCGWRLARRAGWTPQNRSERGVTWGEATRLLWPQTGLGVLVFAGFAAAGWTATLWALPLAGGLLAAIPLCVLTADPRFGRWLRDRQIAAIPEEHPRGPRVPAVAGLALRPQPESD